MELGKIIKELETQFGKIRSKTGLKTDWALLGRTSPLLLEFPDLSLVLHRIERVNNLSFFKDEINKRNQEKLCVSPIITVGKGYYCSQYVTGETPDSRTVDLSDIARMHSHFNRGYDLKVIDYWNERVDRAVHEIRKKGVLRKIPFIPEFTFFGLIHGDVNLKNMIRTPRGIVLIDLEHAMYGPLAYDLARPLLRVCKTEQQKIQYLARYSPRVPQDELWQGVVLFYLLQTHDRIRFGYLDEALSSLNQMNLTLSQRPTRGES